MESLLLHEIDTADTPSQVSHPHGENTEEQEKATTISKVSSGKSGIWGGRRKTVGIKIDETLYNEFKPFAQRYFGSVCCAIEGFMAGFLGAVGNSEVNFGNSVTINDLHVHRNLRERRRIDPMDVMTPTFRAVSEEIARLIVEKYPVNMSPSHSTVMQMFIARGVPSPERVECAKWVGSRVRELRASGEAVK